VADGHLWSPHPVSESSRSVPAVGHVGALKWSQTFADGAAAAAADAVAAVDVAADTAIVVVVELHLPSPPPI